MDCLNPVKIRDPVTGNYISVGCYYCKACQQKRAYQWFVRLKNEERSNRFTYFITLTLNEESLTFGSSEATLTKSDFILFMKRFRKNAFKSKKSDFKYYAVGEYGSLFDRPHYHCILFTNQFNTHQIANLLSKSWKKDNSSLGRIDCEPAGAGSMAYVTGYILNTDDHYNKEKWEEKQRPFSLISKGLGLNYVNKMKDYHSESLERNFVTLEGGRKAKLPDYYAEKIYSDDQKKEIKMKNLKSRYEKLIVKSEDEIKEDLRLKNDRRDQYLRLMNKHSKLNRKL